MGDLDGKAPGPAPLDSSMDRLDSWKEIALFLKRDVSTVQRWEKLEALPVHRHMHGERGTVYAFKSEVAAWWSNRRLKLEAQGQASAQAATQTAVAHDANPEADSAKIRRPFSPSVQRAIGAIGLAMILIAALFFVPKWRVQLAHRPASRLVAVINGNAGLPLFSNAHVMAGDLNGDGVADAVVSMVGAGEAGIFFEGKLRASSNLSPDADVLIQEEQGHQLSLIGMADINGDGMQDLIFADFLPEPQSFTATGPIIVVFGRREWKSKISLPRDADLTISIPVPYSASPRWAAKSGHADLNGDGIDDLIFTLADYSPPGRASAGAVFVFWGRKTWPTHLDISAADVTVWGSQKGEGLSEVSVGDINGDGRNDLVISAGDNTLWYMREGRGRVYAYFGRARFPKLVDLAKDYDVRIDGARPEDHLERMLLADINGDGLQDIVITDVTDPASDNRRIQVFYGRKMWGRNFTNAQPDWQVVASDTSVRVGGAVLARDLTGAGSDDLILCTIKGAEDQLRLFHGGPERDGITSTEAADLVLRVGDTRDGVCGSAEVMAYLDREGVPQVLVAAPLATVQGIPGAGKAYVYAPYVPMKIDIRPGGYPNIVTPGSDGVVAVAILPDGGLDPKSVDVSTLRLAGVPAASSNFCRYNPENEDALCAFFEAKNIRLKLSDRIAILTGKLKDGTPVYGSDSVLVLPLPPEQITNH